MYDCIIIGAGFAGTLTALKMPNSYQILLIEAGDSVIPECSSSFNECYKLHTGMHYIGDEVTARNCLEKSIQFAREFPDFIAGFNQLFSPWRRGRHYVMSNSLVEAQRAVDIASRLTNDYANLIEKDPLNKVFGEIEDFIKLLSKEDFAHFSQHIPYINADNSEQTIQIKLGFETAESQIDIHSIKAFLQHEIHHRSNISFMSSTKVMRLSHLADCLGYQVDCQNQAGQVLAFQSKTIVNCAWQNIELLNRDLGFYMPEEYRTIRIKASIVIELPAILRQLNTFICSAGPYISMTVQPNGTAILTSERITNIGYLKAGYPYELEYKKILKGLTLTTRKGREIANQILHDCVGYFKSEYKAALQTASILELRVGFVKLIQIQQEYTEQSLYKADSVIHARHIEGIEPAELGFVSNSSMKMTYAVNNAKKCATIIEHDINLINRLAILIKTIYQLLITANKALGFQTHNLQSILHYYYKKHLQMLLKNPQTNDNEEKICHDIACEITSRLCQKDSVLSSLRFFNGSTLCSSKTIKEEDYVARP